MDSSPPRELCHCGQIAATKGAYEAVATTQDQAMPAEQIGQARKENRE